VARDSTDRHVKDLGAADRGPVRWVVHFDLDAFFASVERAFDPTLGGKALVVGGTGARGVVSCASYEARALGVHAAMPMYRARQAGKVVVLPVRMAAYRLVSAAVRELWETLGEVHMRGLDEGFIITEGQDLADLRTEVATLVSRTRAELDLSMSVGIAASRTLAKMASEFDKPGGLSVVTPGSEPETLDELPVGRLPGCGPRSREILEQHGVTTIGQLHRTDLGTLTRLLGHRHGEALSRMARGEDPPASETTRQQVSSSRTFDVDLYGRDRILAAILTEAAQAFARREDKAVRSVTLSVSPVGSGLVSRSEKLSAPTDEASRVAEAVSRLWSRMHDTVGGRSVRLVGVGLELSDGGGQGELFSPAATMTLPEITQRPVLLRDGAFHGMRVEHAAFGPGTVLHTGTEGVAVRFGDRVRVIDPRLPLDRVRPVTPHDAGRE